MNAPGQAAASSVEQVITRLERAWNTGDAAAWTAEFTQDCVLITMLGQFLNGPAENQARHAAVFSGIFAGSVLEVEVRALYALDDTVVADLELRLTGYRELPAGVEVSRPESRTHVMIMRIVLVRGEDDGVWRVRFSQNQSVLPAPPGR